MWWTLATSVALLALGIWWALAARKATRGRYRMKQHTTFTVTIRISPLRGNDIEAKTEFLAPRNSSAHEAVEKVVDFSRDSVIHVLAHGLEGSGEG